MSRRLLPLLVGVVPCLTYYLASYEGRDNNAEYQRREVDLQVRF